MLKEIRKVITMKDNRIKGISKKIVSKPSIIWIEINIPSHEFLELVSKIEVTNKKQIIAEMIFLDFFLFIRKKYTEKGQTSANQDPA